MKKKLSLIFGILLMALLLIPNAKVQAEGVAEDLNTGEKVEELTTVIIKTGTDKEYEKQQTYSILVTAEEGSNKAEAVFPMTFTQKGILYCAAAYLDSNPASTYDDFAIYSDEECTKSISYSSYSNTAIIPSKGTYYLKFTATDYNEEKPIDGYYFAFTSKFIGGADRTLTDKAWTVAGNTDTSKPIYYKVTTTKTGSLTIDIESEFSTRITLLNSKKKAISDEAYVYTSDGKASFAVPKGTYYLKVSGSSDTYRIKSTFKAITDNSGTTKAKAKKLTAGKAVNGLVTPGEKAGKVDWYKVTLSKSQTVDITFTGSVSSGEIHLEFYGNGISGSITKYISSVDSDKSFSAQTYDSTKLPKGTYYIKVTKKTKNTSGSYTLKFN
ncbi:hypothetical protein acsn021_19440 [Anaerocolumna cellulosilytica]|uniref:Uncharacterized protein n=1 Tax=Anaerocolumna cellulosilytica TaxID=433286 RepID=A0A6S6R4K8_9FIRM|nr:PPC domain-containing protein [Anaerocolumna cellulosilytica]MBB5194663.1 hypothetical protein [Anaerocolumna cellulosilytica]BCJ94375.1 hypothetical protein acsn021_19440 [Anaerocolumna cellulosilytica]